MIRTRKILAVTMAIGLLAFLTLPGTQALAQHNAAVSLILKNTSEATIDVELVDQYGGNCTASIDSGMSQNQTLQSGSEIKIGGTPVHTVTPADEGMEIAIPTP